jgi:hypothetical protein
MSHPICGREWDDRDGKSHRCNEPLEIGHEGLCFCDCGESSAPPYVPHPTSIYKLLKRTKKRRLR